MHDAKGARVQDRADVLAGLASLYEAWHAAEPDKGYDAKAVEWGAQLNGLGVSSHQAASPRN